MKRKKQKDDNLPRPKKMKLVFSAQSERKAESPDFSRVPPPVAMTRGLSDVQIQPPRMDFLDMNAVSSDPYEFLQRTPSERVQSEASFLKPLPPMSPMVSRESSVVESESEQETFIPKIQISNKETTKMEDPQSSGSAEVYSPNHHIVMLKCNLCSNLIRPQSREHVVDSKRVCELCFHKQRQQKLQQDEGSQYICGYCSRPCERLYESSSLSVKICKQCDKYETKNGLLKPLYWEGSPDREEEQSLHINPHREPKSCSQVVSPAVPRYQAPTREESEAESPKTQNVSGMFFGSKQASSPIVQSGTFIAGEKTLTSGGLWHSSSQDKNEDSFRPQVSLPETPTIQPGSLQSGSFDPLASDMGKETEASSFQGEWTSDGVEVTSEKPLPDNYGKSSAKCLFIEEGTWEPKSGMLSFTATLPEIENFNGISFSYSNDACPIQNISVIKNFATTRESLGKFKDFENIDREIRMKLSKPCEMTDDDKITIHLQCSVEAVLTKCQFHRCVTRISLPPSSGNGLPDIMETIPENELQAPPARYQTSAVYSPVPRSVPTAKLQKPIKQKLWHQTLRNFGLSDKVVEAFKNHGYDDTELWPLMSGVPQSILHHFNFL